MVLELIATGLLAYGVSASSINANNDNYRDNNVNHISESISPNYSSFGNRVNGLYNFKDEINFYNYFGSKPIDYYYYTDIWFDESRLGLCLLSLGGQNLEFVTGLSIELTAGAVNQVYLDFSTYDSNNDSHEHTLTFNDIVQLNELDYPYLFFNYSSFLTLNDNDFEIFNLIFTHDDNANIVSYNGYYNFLTNAYLTNGDKYSVLGNIVYDNVISSGLYLSRSGADSNVNYVIHDVSTDKNIITVVPFDTFRSKTNLLLNGVKMEVDAYNRLSQIGVFSYIRDTSLDNTTFHDLLFTIMDVPVYFITRFFNFELFGMNLAVAFAGLVTLAVMLFIIRIIWRLN